MVELLLKKGTNVYSYFTTTSGVQTIGSLLRVDNEAGYSLDLYESETIPITFQINDVEDPSKKKSPFSKNFQIPGTKRNQLAMGFAYMMSTDEPFRNYRGQVVDGNTWQMQVSEAQIFVNGILAFTGKLELNKVIVDAGEINSFEVNFLATQVNIFDEISDKSVRQLSLPTPVLNSEADITGLFNVVNSDQNFTIDSTTYHGFTCAYPDWGFPGATAGSVYTNPGVYSTTGLCNIFKSSSSAPADPQQLGLRFGYNFMQYAFVKYIMEKIFDGTNFSYSSDFFDSEQFRKLILLCYDSTQLPSNTGIKIFGSSPSATTYYDDLIPIGLPFPASPATYTLENIQDEGTIPGASPFDANEVLADPIGIWNPDDQTLTFTSDGAHTISIKAVVDIRFGWDMYYNGQGAPCPGSGGVLNNVYPWSTYPLLGTQSRIFWRNDARNVEVSRSIFGKSMTSTSIATPQTYVKYSTHYQWESSHDCWSTPLTFYINAKAGDVWQLNLEIDPDKYQAAPVENQGGSSPACWVFPLGERKYEAAIDVLAIDTSPVYHNWSQTLPDISQKDFMIAILKHFNMYSEVAPNSRAITLEPRDGFFNQGTVQDWTTKVDISSVREIQRSDPPLTVYARMKATDNKIDLTAQDTNTDKLEFGSVKVQLENGVEATTTVQSEFGSLTFDKMQMVQILGGLKKRVQCTKNFGGILGSYTWNVPNPALFPTTDTGERQLVEQSEMFLAYRPEIITPISQPSATNIYAWFYLPGDPGVMGYLKTSGGARVADHLWSISTLGSETVYGVDTNFLSTADVTKSWLSGGNTPPVFNNMVGGYEEYYENFFLNLNDQKILTAKVRLDESDIARFSFRNPVWITFPNGDGDYFIVSKINYDPTTDAPSSVELLTFNKEYFNFSYQAVGPGGPIGPGQDYPTDYNDFYYTLPPDQNTGGEYPISNDPPIA